MNKTPLLLLSLLLGAAPAFAGEREGALDSLRRMAAQPGDDRDTGSDEGGHRFVKRDPEEGAPEPSQAEPAGRDGDDDSGDVERKGQRPKKDPEGGAPTPPPPSDDNPEGKGPRPKDPEDGAPTRPAPPCDDDNVEHKGRTCP